MAFKPLKKITGRPLIALITIASTCGFLLFGYDVGFFSGILVSPWFLKTYHHPKSSKLATISAIYNIGGIIGGLIAFFFGQLLGRRKMILVGVVICTIGVVVQSSATNIARLVAGRVVCGIGVAPISATVGMWQAETVPARSRGGYLCFQVVGGAAGGLFLAQWINYGFHASTGRVAFTFPVAFQLVFLVCCGTLVTFLPESPRWLVKKGRLDEAREILARLQPRLDVSQRLAEIVEADALEKRAAHGNQYMQLFRLGPTQNFRRLGLAIGPMIMHQLAGPSTVTYYMPTLLITFIGVDHTTALWVAGLSSVTSIICAMPTVFMIDRLGRRPFLWMGAIFQAVVFIIIAALLGAAKAHSEKAHTYGVAAVVMVFVYFGGNSFAWLSASWAYPAEILPLQIREKGLALGNSFYWLTQFMMVEITPVALTNIGYKFYIILAVFNVCIAVIVFFGFPESKGMSLEEIDFYFVRKYGDEDDVEKIDESRGKMEGGRPKEMREEKATGQHVEDIPHTEAA